MGMQAVVLVAVVLALGAAARAGAATDADNPGRAVYQRYCGACHGPEGRGDGLAGTFMQPKPTDLTQVAKRSGGQFPFQRLMDVIDGRDTVRAHGDPQMPVWGEIFHDTATWDMSRRAEVRGKILLITDYVRSIQEH
jgi:mono/diheme cytochrome c family protein